MNTTPPTEKPLGVPELRFLGDVQRLVLEPGDTVVISTDQHISNEVALRIKEMVRAAIGSEHPILVLGADTGPRGPGPLVSELAGKYAGKLRVPLTIVPGTLSDEDVDAIT